MGLPSNTFLCNYNARDYVPSAHTIPKTEGQLFNQDLVLNANPASYSESSITLNGQSFSYTFSNNDSNPFNRTENDSLTIVAKLKQGTDTTGAHSIISNRGSAYNWMIFNPANGSPVGMVFLHHSLGAYADCPYIQMSDTTIPNIFSFRVSGRNGYGQSYTDNETFRSIVITWGSTTNVIKFFTGYNSGENWRGEFYWIYISQESLTDAEISQVIQYNEGAGLSIDTENLEFSASGGTGTVDVTSTNSWTASTTDNWITISPNTGSTDATVTVTVPYNQFNERTGIIEFTDGEDTLTLTVTQQANTLIPIMKIYRNGNRIN